MLGGIKAFFGFDKISEEEYQKEKQELIEKAPVPVFWLFGKTGSGKTSVVKYLTGAEEAEIGNGFMPQTNHSQQYDFPSPDDPVLRFLDTRGLGESRYDPSEDIQQFDEAAHLMIVTARVMDHALNEVIEPLKKIRQAKPKRPVVLALTCLHEAYPHQQHPQPDPFEGLEIPTELPVNLRRSLQQQGERFEGLVDRIVPIDLTKPEEGFEDPNFGGERLKAALVDMLPAAYRQTLLDLAAAMQPLRDKYERRAMPYVISYSSLAATAAAVPTPWVNIPVVIAIQSHLVYRLRAIYGQNVDTPVLRKAIGAIGGRLATQMLVREPLKLIPFVGMAANAALAYAYTYGLGKACCWYFGELRAGHAPDQEQLERVWKEQIAVASRLWKKHHTEEVQS